MRIALLPILAALAIAGCASHGRGEPRSGVAGRLDWRQVVTENDRRRLRGWRTAWTNAIGEVQAAGHGAALLREGTLLQPDAAIDWRDLPPGGYQCRVIKMGAKSEGLLDYVTYSPFSCRIRPEDGMLSFAKLTGSQRPIGYLFRHSPERMVFLGTLQLGDEIRALEYGHDRERDMAGFLERIGERRWRLIFPYPTFESTIDILELVPRS